VSWAKAKENQPVRAAATIARIRNLFMLSPPKVYPIS
jgi:hypothetical protein